MPLEPIDPIRGMIGGEIPPPVEVGNEPDFSEIVGAAFRQNNTVGSLLASEGVWTPDGPDDLDFDPWAQIKGTPYEERFDRFVDVRSRTKFEAIKNDIDRETQDRETIDRGGLAGTAASIGSAVFDLPTLLPGAGLVRSGVAGYSLARSAVAVGGAAGIGAAVSEGALHATQQTRTLGESAQAIGGSILLGGLLGAGAAKLLGHAEFRALSGAIERDMIVPEGRVEADDLGSAYSRAFSAGAAATERPTLEALDVAPGALGTAKGVASATAQLSPLLRTVTSESAVTRRLASELYENPVYLKMNMEGQTVGSAAETARKQYLAGLGQTIEELQSARKELVKSGIRMSERDFAERVGKAMRRGDVDLNGDEHVSRVASYARQKVIEPLTKAAIEMGLLPKDVKVTTAPSYFSRVWNRKKLNSQEAQFKRVAGEWVRKEATKIVDQQAQSQRSMDALDRLIAEKEKQADEIRARAASDIDAARKRGGNPQRVLAENAGTQGAQAQAGGGPASQARLVERDGASFVDSRNAGVQYHGTSDPDLSPDDWHSSTLNYYGDGLYTTDATDVAYGYSKRGTEKTGERNIYRIKEVRPLNILDGEQPIPREIKDILTADEDGPGDGYIIAGAFDENPKNLRELYDGIRDFGTAEGYSADSIQDIFGTIKEALQKLGYDGLSHLGGLRTKTAPHKVVIYFKPKSDVRVVKSAAEAFHVATGPSVEDIAKAADSELGAISAEIERVRAERVAAEKAMPSLNFDDNIVGDFDAYVDEITNSVFDKLTGRAGEMADPFRITVAARGPLKERTFNIPDELVEPWLDSDARAVLARYTRVLGADVELARRFGDPQMSGAFQEMADDYAALRRSVEKGGLKGAAKEKELRRLAKAEEADKRDIAAGRDLLRGIYLNGGRLEDATWRQVSSVAKLYQYTTKMGGAALSSLSDAGRHVMVHGMGRVMGEGLPALLGRVKGQQSGYAQSVRQARLGGQVWESLLQTRLATLAELSDPYSAGSPFERFVGNIAAWFSRLNLLGMWNDFNKGFASVLTQDRIIDNALSGVGKIDAKERAYLAYLGIDEGMATRIARQLQQSGAEKVDGVWVANTERWTDEVARRRFYDAVNKDVDSIVVSKGIGDVPLFMNTPVGSMMGQFKSFLLASNQRVLIRGLQEDQANFLMGLTTMVTLGMASSALYSLASGRPMSDNPGKWLAEGIDRSGVFSVAFEINNMAAKVGAPDVYMGLQSLFPGEQKAPASRFASRGVAGTLLGPSFGTLVDTGTAGRALTTGEWAQSDVNALRRLLPYQNLFYIRRALDALQDEVIGQ